MENRLKESKPTGRPSKVLNSNMCEISWREGGGLKGTGRGDGVKWKDLGSTLEIE